MCCRFRLGLEVGSRRGELVSARNERIPDFQVGKSGEVSVRILPMSVDEDVGVQGDHPPRPSQATSRI